MSNPHGHGRGWRAQLHHLSRRTELLKRVAVTLALGSFLLAWVLVQIVPEPGSPSRQPDPVEQAVRRAMQNGQTGTEARPRQYAQWLRLLLKHRAHLSKHLNLPLSDWESYQRQGTVASFPVRELLPRHAPEPAQRELFDTYLQAALAAQPPQQAEALARLAARAAQEPPPPLANALHADLLATAEDGTGALQAWMREARAFPDARVAREEALRLALQAENLPLLREIAQDDAWMAQMSPGMVSAVGSKLGDLTLLYQGLLRHRVEEVPWGILVLVLYVTSLWYVIFAAHAPVPGPRPRWVWPLLPLLAGAASVVPVLAVGPWQEETLGMSEHAPFPQDLWYWVAGVGLREEVCKLLFALPFMPWLLRRRAPGLALLTGAFVGLGFALDENIDYYQDGGSSVAVTRFLQANFLHAAMTGLATHALYWMLRTRFAHAERFIGTFLAVVAVHGAYDYSLSVNTGVMGYLTLALTAYTAWQFLDLLEQEVPHPRQTVAPAAIFMLGTAVLMAVIFLMTAWEKPETGPLLDAAESALGIVPIAFIYWHRFQARSGMR